MINNLRDGLYNQTLLANASGHNHLSIVTFLLQHYHDVIDVWAVDEVGQNAYHLAAMMDHVDVMKLLLNFDRSGLDVGDNINGWTPLHWAADENNKRMVEMLLGAGADVNVVDNKGRTPDRMHEDVSSEIRDMIQQHRKK